MATAPLMPKATAVWLVDNTSLTFEQIAHFCVLHPLEVKAIADGDAAQGIKGMDPMLSGQLTREEIEKAEADPSYRMKISEPKVRVPEVKRRGPRYTPVSKRQDRPNAILWLVRNHAELKDAQIMRLVGTTKPTIQAIRERTHWNSATLHADRSGDARPLHRSSSSTWRCAAPPRPRRRRPSRRARASSPPRRRRRSAPAPRRPEARRGPYRRIPRPMPSRSSPS